MKAYLISAIQGSNTSDPLHSLVYALLANSKMIKHHKPPGPNCHTLSNK